MWSVPRAPADGFPLDHRRGPSTWLYGPVASDGMEPLRPPSAPPITLKLTTTGGQPHARLERGHQVLDLPTGAVEGLLLETGPGFGIVQLKLWTDSIEVEGWPVDRVTQVSQQAAAMSGDDWDEVLMSPPMNKGLGQKVVEHLARMNGSVGT